MARKFKNLKKEIKYRKRPCYNSYAHNKYFLQQGGATKQKFYLMNNPSDITVWQQVERLKTQPQRHFMDQEVYSA